jgi:hypothetical protein
MVSNVGVATIGVATVLVGLPVFCLSLPETFLGLVLFSESASRREASVCQRRVLWLPRLMFATYCIWCRHRDDWRRFSSVFSCFPAVMNLESASRRQALQRSASIFQRLVMRLH